MTQTQIIFSFLLYIVITVGLRAERDFWAIERWKDNINSAFEVKMWHLFGFLFSAWVVTVPLFFIYKLKAYAIGWNFAFVSLLGAFFFWILFDIWENLRRGLDWDHIGNSEIEKALKKYILPIKFFGLILSLIGALMTMV